MSTTKIGLSFAAAVVLGPLWLGCSGDDASTEVPNKAGSAGAGANAGMGTQQGGGSSGGATTTTGGGSGVAGSAGGVSGGTSPSVAGTSQTDGGSQSGGMPAGGGSSTGGLGGSSPTAGGGNNVGSTKGSCNFQDSLGQCSEWQATPETAENLHRDCGDHFGNTTKPCADGRFAKCVVAAEGSTITRFWYVTPAFDREEQEAKGTAECEAQGGVYETL